MSSGKELLGDDDVRRWADNLAEGSHWTRKAFLHHLAKYCDYRGLTPQEIVNEFESDKKRGQDYLEDYLRALKAQGKAPASIKMALSAVKSWLGRFELVVTRKIKINGTGIPQTLLDEKVPTRGELEKVLDCSDVRTRAVLSFIAEAGLRYESIAGLRLRDLPEVDLSTGKALKTPMRINVREDVSKNRKPFFTFLAEPKYLEAYLAERRTWDAPTPDRPIFVAARTFGKKDHKGMVRKGDPMTSGGLSMEVRHGMRLAGLKQRPYVWRSYFDTTLLNSRCDKDVQSFVMGHSGTIETTYTLRKNLSEEMIESIRSEVTKAFRPATDAEIEALKASTATQLVDLQAQLAKSNSEITDLKQTIVKMGAFIEEFSRSTGHPVKVYSGPEAREQIAEGKVLDTILDKEGRLRAVKPVKKRSTS